MINTLSEQNIKKTDEKDIAAQIPDKFLDDDGELKTKDLLKSYLELEKKMSAGKSQTGLTIPKSADQYQLTMKSPLIQEDPQINEILFKNGFSNEQAQIVYDLAAEKVIPLLQSLMDDVSADNELKALEEAFGGPEQFNIIARQISAWGEKHLDQKTFNSLSSTKDGILTMYKMMQGNLESPLIQGHGRITSQDDENSLKKLMQDPKYWRDQDPELLKRVEDGFKRLYD